MTFRSCRKDRVTDEDILTRVRRFGPLTTNQICIAFGFTDHGILNRLKRINGLTYSDKPGSRSKVWSVK